MIEITPNTPETPLSKTVVDRIRASAKRDPDREAIVCGDHRLTWRAFDDRINRAANMAIALGVQPGTM